MAGKIWISTTSGIRGRFAVMFDDDGAIQTGMTCKTFKQCKDDAIAWAKDEFGEKWQDHTDLQED
jgi:hypothetical protein